MKKRHTKHTVSDTFNLVSNNMAAISNVSTAFNAIGILPTPVRVIVNSIVLYAYAGRYVANKSEENIIDIIMQEAVSEQ